MSVIKAEQAKVISEWLPKLCEALLKVDPEIVAIVQFGSSVYAPELANDIDLFVVTKQRKDFSVYLEAVKDCPVNVDVVPVQVGERVGFMATGVRAFGRLVWGDANVVCEVTKDMPIPTFDEARRVIDDGDIDVQIAPTLTDPIMREARYRKAFNSLFDAARLAAMAFLLTEETRWGILANRLPDPFDQRFRSIVEELHVIIFYRRQLPLDAEAEYKRWREVVGKFIDDLESAQKQ